jgi:hypothetical protein
MTSSEFTTVAEGGGVGVAFCGILTLEEQQRER